MQKSHATISLAGMLISFLGACASTTTPQKTTANPAGAGSSDASRGQPATSQVVICPQTADRSRTPSERQGLSTRAAGELANLKAKVMAADYRANLEELGRLRDALSRWRNDPGVSYLAYYWSGFASWRTAINGANHQMKADELTANLKNAASDFYSAMRLKDDFADAYAAASLVNGWLATMVDPQERLSLAAALSARAATLDPENPRVLWVKGAFFLYAPESQGGSIPRAIEVYRQMLREADRRGVNAESPCPDWGKPEALMSLAFAHTQLKPADLSSAREEATAALRVEPEWSYVKDNLLPKIERQLRVEMR